MSRQIVQLKITNEQTNKAYALLQFGLLLSAIL